jgi:hypothetical protein
MNSISTIIDEEIEKLMNKSQAVKGKSISDENSDDVQEEYALPDDATTSPLPSYGNRINSID